jgi:CDP-diacylglycerol pyrophosphatase
MTKDRWRIGLLVIGVGLLGAAVALDSARDRLRMIVQEQCVPHWIAEHSPAPCVSVGGGDPEPGYAVLHDRKGGAHFLLIPTRSIVGMESPEAWNEQAVNYFDAAWRARAVLDSMVGHGVPRGAIGMAINPLRARSQDQLHIHIECLGREVHAALSAGAAGLTSGWSTLTVDGRPYQATRIVGSELGEHNPIRMLAGSLAPGADLAHYTLLVAGVDFADGPGWAVLAAANAPGAELLLDPTCELAGP